MFLASTAYSAAGSPLAATILGLISAYFWFLWLVVPVFAFYKVWVNILSPWFFQEPPPEMDEKKAKRILANRISAQKSRMRKLNFIGGLEKNVAALQNQIEVLKPQLEKAVQQNCDLKKINNELKKQRESLLNS